MLTTRNCHFNPRSLTGATFDIHVFSTQISISIHAPSRERRCCSISIGIPHIFQSTLPRGSDYLTATELLSIVEFQSTLPRGSDASALIKPLIRKDFNPRSLAGATKADGTPARRCEFQSTLPRGSDDTAKSDLRQACISIHAPSRERRQPAAPIARQHQFQSTLPRGSDADGQRLHYCCAGISIHAPSRERPQRRMRP